MQIKFIPPDPRAGMTVTMDSSRGQFFIDNGNAVAAPKNGGDGAEVTFPLVRSPDGKLGVKVAGVAPSAQEEQVQDNKPARDLPTLAAAFVDGTVPDVTARIEGADEELLKAALATETASEKPRKGVVDALTAALNPQA